ncbi:uncharacterized protein LOC6546908 [Drosophila erecta]|uniref:Uncharacterized protein n=1 Tax=Drosophila erecta TaxID=7220 RepID=B3NS85_DROER|nr:uncharacterized protein LOC6546908 [Drosophila erecta]EDV56387.1 uncharacterized protein Dere_GG20246 [Drosophila erecta]
MEKIYSSVGVLEQNGRKSDELCVTLFLSCVHRNVSTSTAMGELIVFVLFLVGTFYTIIFFFRLALSLVKPFLTVVIALLIFRFLVNERN